MCKQQVRVHLWVGSGWVNILGMVWVWERVSINVSAYGSGCWNGKPASP